MKKFILVIYFTFCFIVSCAYGQNIDVAVVHDQYTAEISCDSEFTVVDNANRQATEFPKGKYFLNVKKHTLHLGDTAFSNKITFKANTEPVKINKLSFAGNLQASVKNDKLLIVNSLDLEEYLKDTMSLKASPIWPDEALKAQIIAARSYALYKIQNSADYFDITANDEELFYTGNHERKAAIAKMVDNTKGRYLADNAGQAIMAITTSSSGGQTEAYKDIFGADISYLQSVKDFDKDSPEYEWEYKLSPKLLQILLEQSGYNVGELQGITLSDFNSQDEDRTGTGRVKYIIVTGKNGNYQINGYDIMKILSLNSNKFAISINTPLPENLDVPIENYFGMEIGRKDIDIDAKKTGKAVWQGVNNKYHLLKGNKEEKITFKGYSKGLGIGLSIWGAKGMADASKANTYQKILQHYYPDTRLKTI